MIKLNSAYICGSNMARAIDFYGDFLELPVHEEDQILSVFPIQGFRLCLFNIQQVGEDLTYGHNCLLSFEVDNIDTAMQRLSALNAPLVFPLRRSVPTGFLSSQTQRAMM